MKISALVSKINGKAPFSIAEKWDNCGLTIGDPSAEIEGAVVCLDVTAEAIDFAVSKKANLVIAHHPLIFGQINSVNPRTLTGSLIYKAVRANVGVLVLHTNFDKSPYNSAFRFAEDMGLGGCAPLMVTDREYLKKIAVFVPTPDCPKVKKALSEAGAGVLGNYAECGYMIEGEGEFTGNENSNPAIGAPMKMERVRETRLEMIFAPELEGRVVEAMKRTHPYEEPAYDIYALQNVCRQFGYGAAGEYEKPIASFQFIRTVKEVVGDDQPLVTVGEMPKTVKKVGILNGSGFDFYRQARDAGCDVFITGDISYHRAQELKFSGLFTIDCTHFGTEKNFLQCASELLNRINLENKWNLNFYLADMAKNPMERL